MVVVVVVVVVERDSDIHSLQGNISVGEGLYM